MEEGVLTLAVAALGSWLFYKAKVPAGALIGAILFSAVLHLGAGIGDFPSMAKPVVQAIAGGFIGQRISRKDLSEIRQILGAGVLVFLCMAVYTLAAGWFMALVTPLDLATALASTMPAGLSDTAIISADMGADPALSTVMQMVRTLFSVILLPQIAFRICGKYDPVPGAVDPTCLPGYKPPEVRTTGNLVITIALAIGMGLCGKATGLPAGAMIFAVLAVAAWNVGTGRAYLTKPLRLAAQCVAGVIVGSRISAQDVENMKGLLLPMVISAVGLVVCNAVCAWLLYRVCRVDLSTSLFGTIPAGVSDMALISSEMGGDAPKVAVLQLVRYVGILCIMPSVIKLLTRA